jgi:hypothetical protein
LRQHVKFETAFTTWAGFVYMAFVIDVYARYIVGWRVSRQLMPASCSMRWSRLSTNGARSIVAASFTTATANKQYVSIRYAERLAEAGIEPSVGSVGDSYDNALAETINGLYKAEVIHRRGPWRSFEAVEFATLEWVDWFNHRRLLEPIGNIPPAEAEELYYAMLDGLPNLSQTASGKLDAVQAIPNLLNLAPVKRRFSNSIFATSVRNKTGLKECLPLQKWRNSIRSTSKTHPPPKRLSIDSRMPR